MKVSKRMLGAGLAIGTAVGLSGTMVSAYEILKNVTHPQVKKYDEVYKKQIGSGFFDEQEFHKWEKEEFFIPSLFGYDIHGFFIPKPRAKGTVLILHGITMNLWSSIKYGLIFRELGFNLCLIDYRNHGLSGGEYTTMGILERYDAKVAIDYIIKKTKGVGIIGVHGESMGAGTAMLLPEIEERIDFIVEDCGYSSIVDELKVRLKEEYHLPSFPLLNIADWYMRKQYALSFYSHSPIEVVKTVSIPMLFIHGGKDTYVPTYMVEQLYKAKKGKKQLKIFTDASHAGSYASNKTEYKATVKDFLETNGLL